jgi:hypothetical protein
MRCTKNLQKKVADEQENTKNKKQEEDIRSLLEMQRMNFIQLSKKGRV